MSLNKILFTALTLIILTSNHLFAGPAGLLLEEEKSAATNSPQTNLIPHQQSLPHQQSFEDSQEVSQQTTLSLPSMPPEILSKIISYLWYPEDLLSLAQVCTFFHRFVSENIRHLALDSPHTKLKGFFKQSIPHLYSFQVNGTKHGSNTPWQQVLLNQEGVFVLPSQLKYLKLTDVEGLVDSHYENLGNALTTTKISLQTLALPAPLEKHEMAVPILLSLITNRTLTKLRILPRYSSPLISRGIMERVITESPRDPLSNVARMALDLTDILHNSILTQVIENNTTLRTLDLRGLDINYDRLHLSETIRVRGSKITLIFK